MSGRRIALWIALLPVLVLTSWRAESQDTPQPIEWRFEKDKAGEAPTGFVVESGEWKVVDDDSAPTKGHVLAQVAAGDAQSFNLILVKDARAKQVDVGVKFKSVAGKVDQGGGLVWRVKDAKNYFLCRYNPLEGNLRLYKIVDGKRTIIDSLDLEVAGGWHSLRVAMRDDKITYFFDDQARGYIPNDAFMDEGRIGLWTKADAQTHFDDLSFTVLP